ncbi:DinB family protein [Saccharopolyspora sp. CA-218241]|uniref:DinB family protein n=1 Tax=Saccharopolyspora sp. CA-218241 TaxID=3240027 RepID=UPI003D951A73
MATRLDLLRDQFDLTWALLELHLDQLAPEDFRWEPAAHCWTVRPGPDGGWVADFAEVEPEPIPVPTIAWTTWHLGWWWSAALDHLRGDPPRAHQDVRWPGDGAPTTDWLRGLRTEWLAALDRLTDADLDATATFPWGEQAPKTVAHTAAWVNAELMKNTAELGQLRLLRTATTTRKGRE